MHYEKTATAIAGYKKQKERLSENGFPFQILQYEKTGSAPEA
ncbi:MAG: hypothetical protein R2941_12695 [Desulfobacterales bacterium]